VPHCELMNTCSVYTFIMLLMFLQSVESPDCKVVKTFIIYFSTTIGVAYFTFINSKNRHNCTLPSSNILYISALHIGS
jgi:hypothetical protein